MKYKDYLLVPILAMYILYASCAYIAENGGIGSKEPAEPEAAAASMLKIAGN